MPDKIRLLLRSVYLKGHQDGNLKTSDLSWEDKICLALIDYFQKEIVPEKRKHSKNCVDPEVCIDLCGASNFNRAIDQINAKLEKER